MDKFALDDFRSRLAHRKEELQGRLVKIEHDLDEPMNADVPDRVTEREGDEVLEGLGLAGCGEDRAPRHINHSTSPAKAGVQLGWRKLSNAALRHGRFPTWAPAFAGVVWNHEALSSVSTARLSLV